MTNYMNGEAHVWNGGECPVPEETKVEVWLRSKALLSGSAYRYAWYHDEDCCSDITTFRVIPPEPGDAQ